MWQFSGNGIGRRAPEGRKLLVCGAPQGWDCKEEDLTQLTLDLTPIRKARRGSPPRRFKQRRTRQTSLNRQWQALLRNATWGRIIDRCDIHSVVAGGGRRALKHPRAKQFYAGRQARGDPKIGWSSSACRQRLRVGCPGRRTR